MKHLRALAVVILADMIATDCGMALPDARLVADGLLERLRWRR